MNIPWVVIRSPTKHWSSEQGTCNILLKRPYNWSLEVFNWRMIPFKIWFKWRIQPSASLTTFLQLQNVMRGSETVSKYPFAHSSLQLHEISTYMPHETLHCKKILDYLSTIRWEKCLPSKSIIANQQQSGPMKEQHLIVRLLIRIEMQQDSTSKHTNNNKPRCYNFIAWQRLAVKQLKCHDQYAIISLTLTLWEKWLNVHL